MPRPHAPVHEGATGTNSGNKHLPFDTQPLSNGLLSSELQGEPQADTRQRGMVQSGWVAGNSCKPRQQKQQKRYIDLIYAHLRRY